ncbi:hypothetical protein Fmac_013434 [Flemingia macrophylla]|uniref:Uncharacterized protein n=1 Tax=Flemingia macrophylla TaxID=520843 RepID=A0ABD1MU25_9FABA
MGVFTFEEEDVSPVAPAQLYKAFAKDSDTILPKVVEAIQSIEIVEGNGAPEPSRRSPLSKRWLTHIGRIKWLGRRNPLNGMFALKQRHINPIF